MPLDSDIPNPDAHLHVEFYEQKNEATGYKGKTFIRIVVPGDKTNVFDQPVREDHKARFPRQWMHYQMQSDPEAPPIYGTTLKAWHEEAPDQLSEVMMIELQILKFSSVEQVAAATDTQLQRIGMGAAGLRIRAQNYLNSKHRDNSVLEADAGRKEVEDLKAQVAEMVAMIKAMNRPAEPAPPPIPAKIDRRRKEPLSVQYDAAIGDAGNG